MFRFDFQLDDAEEFDDLVDFETQKFQESQAPALELEPFSEIPFQQLLDSIPQLISYSPLQIPLLAGESTTLVRRDLFDARFQLISEGAGDAMAEEGPPGPDRKALEFLDAPSDLVPGIYEGGLKTWECSLDLVNYLDGESKFAGKRILELGCGTGVPSMYILRDIFGETPAKTEIHLQDYNVSVLQLVTLPNILLTWYTSDHANAYRQATNDPELAPTIDLNIPGELPISAELKAAFVASLESLNISLRFFSGSWDTFGISTRYDIVLTSETIYRTDSLAALVDLLQTACTGKSTSLEGLVSSLSVEEVGPTPDYLCLVAAKVLYFGVGGGVSDFLRAVEERKGRVDTVLERTVGVGRKVMRVHWV